MPDTWEEALERLDVTIEDFFDTNTLIARLDEVLGRPASALQIDLARVALSREFGQLQQLALFQGSAIDRFTRRGQNMFQLRDRLGRFVATGITSITRRLAQGSG